MITSKENQKIKFTKSLKKVRKRKQYKCFLAEGFKLVQEAIKAGMEIECLFYSPGAYRGRKENILFLKKLIQNKNIESHFISDSLMDSLCDTVTGQGIMAVLKGEVPEIEDMDFSDNIWVLAFEVQDPGNLGTIIRTAEAAGFYQPRNNRSHRTKSNKVCHGSLFPHKTIYPEKYGKVYNKLQK